MPIMPKRSYSDKLHLDMPLDEALERFAGVTPEEMQANIKRAKTKKPPGGKKAPSDGTPKGKNVVSLRQRRVRKRNTGR
jgi:hypothetical protein